MPQKTSPELCIEVKKEDFLAICTQLTQQGCVVVAVNEFFAKPLIWLANSPLIQTQFVSIPNNKVTCAGFHVTLIPNKIKGKHKLELKGLSYFDLLKHCKEVDVTITSWSPPTWLSCPKIVYK
jgi:hypothetical protein